MKTIQTILSVIVLAGGCSTSVDGGGSAEDTPPSTVAPTTTVATTTTTTTTTLAPPAREDLEAAVQAAAQLVLDSSGLEVVEHAYDKNDVLWVTEWNYHGSAAMSFMSWSATSL